MYTPPLEAPSNRPAPSASFEKSGGEKSRDNGFSDLIRDRNATDRATPPRTHESRPSDPRPHDSRSRDTRQEDTRQEDIRPREPRTDAREETRDPRPVTETPDTEPRQGRETATDEKTPAKHTTAKNDAEPTGSEQPDVASEPEAVPAEPTTVATATVEDQMTVADLTTQTFTDELPNHVQMLDAAANAPAAGATADLTGAPAKTVTAVVTPDAADVAGETTAATAEGNLVSGQQGTVIPEATANQQSAAAQGTVPQSGVQSQIAGISGANPSPSNNAADNAAETEHTASSPLAAVAVKPVTGTRDASASGAPTSPTAPTATPGAVANSDAPSPALLPADAEGDFKTALTTTPNSQGAKSEGGQSSAPTANAIPSAGNPDAVNTTAKTAEMLSATDSILPRIADAPPPATASSNAPNTAPAASFGSELRVVSDTSPLTETAAARTTPNTVANQLAVQINRAVVDGQDKIVINLKPGTLGRVSINLEVGHDNRLIAVISAEKPDTLEFLQRDARTLERALQEAGIKTDSGSLSFNLQGHGADDSPSDDFSNDGPFAALPLSGEDVDNPIANSTTAAYAASASGIDIHV